MPIKHELPWEELPPDDLETWNTIKLILSNQELCDEQSTDLVSADAGADEMDSWIRSIFSKNLTHKNQVSELSKVKEKIAETSRSDFLSLTNKIRDELNEKSGTWFMLSQDDIDKLFIKFTEAQERESKNNSENISDYEIHYEPYDHKLFYAKWFAFSDNGDLTPLYEPGGREYAWTFNGQPKECLKSIQLNHSKSCPDIIIRSILPQPHQPHQGTEIHSILALYWCTKVLMEDGSYERCKKTTSEGIEEDWRGVYLLSSDIETFASCIKDKIMKLCRSVFTYRPFKWYRTEA